MFALVRLSQLTHVFFKVYTLRASYHKKVEITNYIIPKNLQWTTMTSSQMILMSTRKKIIANESGCVSISHKIDELHDVIAGNSRIPFIYSWTRDEKKKEHPQEHTHSRWKHIKWWVDACKFVQKNVKKLNSLCQTSHEFQENLHSPD